MRIYRVNSLDSNGRIAFAQQVLCKDDLDALAEGEKLFDQNPVEVWQSGRFIGSFKLDDEPVTADGYLRL